jgi:hypothetical protein
MQVAMNLGYAVRPFQREACCGDMGDSWRLPQRRVLALADGLGQGPEAERAAAAAMQCVGDYVDLDCEDIWAAGAASSAPAIRPFPSIRYRSPMATRWSCSPTA